MANNSSNAKQNVSFQSKTCAQKVNSPLSKPGMPTTKKPPFLKAALHIQPVVAVLVLIAVLKHTLRELGATLC